MLDRRSFLAASSFVALPKCVLAQSNSCPTIESKSFRIALLMGNFDYRALCGDRSCNLNSPIHDVAIMESVLNRLGFTVLPPALNCNASQMHENLLKFNSLASVASIAFFYYSGHAIQVDGKNYLLPCDNANFDDSDNSDSTNWFAVDRVLHATGRAENIGIVVLDACRDSPSLARTRREISQFGKDEAKLGLADIPPKDYFLTAFSSAPGQLSRDGRRGQPSPYTSVLARELLNRSNTVAAAFFRTQTSVCDITTPGDSKECQQPFVSTNLGALPISFHLSPQIAASSEPILVNLTVANPMDPAIGPWIENEQHVYRYPYTIAPDSTGKSLDIFPDLEYFVSQRDSNIPRIWATGDGYYDPSEGSGVWGISFPVLDIVSRTLRSCPIRLEKCVFSYIGRPDLTPYTTLITEGAHPFSLSLVNEGWDKAHRGKLKFNIIGYEEPTEDEVDSLFSNLNDKYKTTMDLELRDAYTRIDLYNELAKVLPEMKYYKWLSEFTEIKIERGRLIGIKDISSKDGVSIVGRMKSTPPAGFAEWWKSIGSKRDEDKHLFVFGTLEVASQRGLTATIEFIAGIGLSTPGVGSGSISYTSKTDFVLESDNTLHVLERDIDYLLKPDMSPFRGLFSLKTTMTSRFKANLSLIGDGGKELYKSPDLNIHIVLSKPSVEIVGLDWLSSSPDAIRAKKRRQRQPR